MYAKVSFSYSTEGQEIDVEEIVKAIEEINLIVIDKEVDDLKM